MELTKYVACICEGAAEQAIIELLLDADKLIFTYDDLLEGGVIRCRGAQNFERRYLRKGFSEKITVLRILDSRREQFNLSKAYAGKIEVINVITAPEIEMLVICNERAFDAFKKTDMLPNIFCKVKLGFSEVKSSEFIKKYFEDIDILLSAIHEYKRVSRIPHNEYALADLLK